MFFVDSILLICGILLLLGIASSKMTSRIGIPGLVFFLFIGMLAGSEGIGGLAFENTELAHGIGTLALALILFDGGLRTPFASVARAWKPAGLLATVGIFLTAALTAVAGVYILGLSWPIAFLLGSIISSTDAAAVFSVLRKQGLQLDSRLASTVEIESGANDPMAIFLTIVCIEILLGQLQFGLNVGLLLALQLGVGAAVGILVGKVGAYLINEINLDAAGLYPVLATALAFLAFGIAANLGGSGFLAIYLAGLWIGNQRLVFQRGIYLSLDAAAWTAQILMFTMLGLLIFPSEVLAVSTKGALLAVVLTFFARPVMVFCTMPFFGFNWREMVFLSWAGLKGAVPIILAIYPLLFGLEEGQILFNVVFFVVLFSAITQGWSLPLVARKLGLQKGEKREPRIQLELLSLAHVDSDLVEYHIEKDSPICGQALKDVPFPYDVHIAMIAREHHVVPSRGGTQIKHDDYVFIVHPREARPLIDRLLAGTSPREAPWPRGQEILFHGSPTVGELTYFYGITVSEDPEQTLEELWEQVGSEVASLSSGWRLRVQKDLASRTVLWGLTLMDPPGVDPSR